MAFHSIRGWYFERLDDGVVRISKRDVDNTIEVGVELPAETWASAVASVSADGETGRTFNAAKALHAGAGSYEDAEYTALLVAIDQRRGDSEFMERLRRRVIEDKPLLDRLAGGADTGGSDDA